MPFVVLRSGVIVVLGKTFSAKAKVGMSRLRKMFKARKGGEGTKNQRSQQQHEQQVHKRTEVRGFATWETINFEMAGSILTQDSDRRLFIPS